MPDNFSSKFKIDKDVLAIVRYSLYFVLGILFLLLAFYLFILFEFSDHGKLKITDSGAIGDTINGLFAPFIGSLAVATTFLAFIVQYQANQNQRRDLQLERFERKFYELLKLHKENVNELTINNYKGREGFKTLFKELLTIAVFIESVLKDSENKYTLNLFSKARFNM